MHDLTGSVECALGFPVVDLKKIFEYLTEHFRVNGNFALHWLILAHGEVITVKDVQNAVCFSAFFRSVRENLVWDREIVVLPIISVNRLKQSAGKERNTAVKRRTIPLLTTVTVECIIKQRLK